tara:strand:- start:1349 stop:1645 length:297 start_codon:yes stop_codon:yes gene_type:complete
MAVLTSVHTAKRYYFGHCLRDYMNLMIDNNIYESAIELDKGVKVILSKNTYTDNKGVVRDYIQLYAGRGNNFTVKESTNRINWEKTDKLGIYKPKWRN